MVTGDGDGDRDGDQDLGKDRERDLDHYRKGPDRTGTGTGTGPGPGTGTGTGHRTGNGNREGNRGTGNRGPGNQGKGLLQETFTETGIGTGEPTKQGTSKVPFGPRGNKAKKETPEREETIAFQRFTFPLKRYFPKPPFKELPSYKQTK